MVQEITAEGDTWTLPTPADKNDKPAFVIQHPELGTVTAEEYRRAEDVINQSSNPFDDDRVALDDVLIQVRLNRVISGGTFPIKVGPWELRLQEEDGSLELRLDEQGSGESLHLGWVGSVVVNRAGLVPNLRNAAAQLRELADKAQAAELADELAVDELPF
jgi:hypothetical protein